jgi:hypothetical protein
MKHAAFVQIIDFPVLQLYLVTVAIIYPSRYSAFVLCHTSTITMLKQKTKQHNLRQRISFTDDTLGRISQKKRILNGAKLELSKADQNVLFAGTLLNKKLQITIYIKSETQLVP